MLVGNILVMIILICIIALFTAKKYNEEGFTFLIDLGLIHQQKMSTSSQFLICFWDWLIKEKVSGTGMERGSEI